MDGIRIASTALTAGQTSLDVTSNNLANVNTSGFKSDAVNLYSGPGGRGVAVGSISKDMSPGPVAFTGKNLDLALGGDAFFPVRRGNGSLAFTRDGSFTIDAQGRIATQNGDLLDPPITVPKDATAISVGRDGSVSATRSDGTTASIGTIQPVRFPNPAGMEVIGNNLAVPTANSGAGMRDANAEMLSGGLELSNTDIASEMVNLIKDERFIQMNAKVVQAEDENLGTLLDMKR